MFKFFTPVTKVQKDRAIMRETDARLAKYSRRGLIFNFLAFLLCLIGGNFVEKQQGLAIILTVGLLLFTLLRGFFLFRFEALYPRAPAKWRNSYFLATLLGAAWWGVILVSITLVLKMEDEAPLLWLYTVVFFSTTAHAFAPYQRFLTVYQFMGQVPAAFAALLIPDVNAWLYAILLLAFYVMLVHQCRLMSEDYWQKLAATYALAKKTENLEEEKRGTRATAELNQEFMNNLHSDLSEMVQLTELNLHNLRSGGDSSEFADRLERAQDVQARIFSNVDDYRGLLTKELTLQTRVFNVRHELQALVSEAVDAAEFRALELESALSPTIPMRLEGDAIRFAQIVRTILSSAMQNVSNALILVEADFLREFEASGDLQVTISRQPYGKKRFFQAEEEEGIASNLDLSVCKGLAESMEGTLTVSEGHKGGHQIRFRAKFNVPEVNSELDFHKDVFAGHSVLVVHHNPVLLEVKRRELHALGLSVRTESQYRRAYQTLVNSYRENAPVECVLFYVQSQNDEDLEFSRSLLEHKELRNTHQLIASSPSIIEQKLLPDDSYVHRLPQPTGLYEMGMAFYQIYAGNSLVEDVHTGDHPSLNLLYVDTLEGAGEFGADQLQLAGAEVTTVKVGRIDRELLAGHHYDVVVLECGTEGPNCTTIIEHIRRLEKELERLSLVPMVGVGWQRPLTFYEQGFDHFIDLSEPNVPLDTTLRYWAGL